MSFNLCDLLPDDKALIEVDKAAAYAVWKERNGQLAKAEMDGGAFKDHHMEVFIKALAKYRAKP
jgi:DNA polymerase III subunit theta